MSSLLEEKRQFKGRKFVREDRSFQEYTGAEFYVVSEPGDHTRYTYFVKRQGHYKYIIDGSLQHFNYPEFIDLISLSKLHMSDKALIAHADSLNCNPVTYAEVIAACEEIDHGESIGRWPRWNK